jgi:hypothetical protein
VHQALAPARLRAQRLVGEPLPDPVAVVRHLGAVQAQEHTTVPWSVGRRCAAASIEQVLGPLDDGGVVRTHALRTTWHLLHVDDLPWLVAATGDRVMAQVVPHVRRQGSTRRPCSRPPRWLRRPSARHPAARVRTSPAGSTTPASH